MWELILFLRAMLSLLENEEPLFTGPDKTISPPALTGYNSESRREMQTTSGFINKAKLETAAAAAAAATAKDKGTPLKHNNKN